MMRTNIEQEDSLESQVSTEALYSEEEDEIIDQNSKPREAADRVNLLSRCLAKLEGLLGNTCEFMIDHENLYFSCNARSAAVLKDFMDLFEAKPNPDQKGEYIISAQSLKDHEHTDLSNLETKIKLNNRKLELFLEFSHILRKSNHKNTEEGLKLIFSTKEDSDAFIFILKKSLPEQIIPENGIYPYDFVFEISEEKLKAMKEDAHKAEEEKKAAEENKLLTEKMVYEFQTQLLFLIDRKKWSLRNDFLCLSDIHPKFQVILLQLFEPHGLTVENSTLKIKTEAIVRLPPVTLNSLVLVAKDYQIRINTFSSLVRKLWPDGKSALYHQNEGFEFPHKIEWQNFLQKTKLSDISKPSPRETNYRLIHYVDVLNLGQDAIKQMLEEATKIAKNPAQAAALPQTSTSLHAQAPATPTVQKTKNPYPEKKLKETPATNPASVAGANEKLLKITPCHWICLLSFELARSKGKPDCIPDLWRIDALAKLFFNDKENDIQRSEAITEFFCKCWAFSKHSNIFFQWPEEREQAFFDLIREAKNLHKNDSGPSCFMQKTHLI